MELIIKHKLKQFIHCNNGANAIEFAIVAPLFLLIIFSIFEVGFIFITDITMENALNNSARQVRTGQSQNDGAMTAEIFKTNLCAQTYNIVNCDNVNVEVNVFESFEDSQNLPDLLDVDGELNNNAVFNMGGAGSIIIIRTTYIYDIVNPFGNLTQLSNYGDNQYLQVHIAAFINEPFS